MKNIGESILYTMVSVIGSIIPFFVLAALIYFNGQDLPEYRKIIGEGELAIVCISLGIGVIYSLISNATKIGSAVFKTASFFWLHIIFWLTFIFFIVGVTIYSSSMKDIYIANSNEKSENIIHNYNNQNIIIDKSENNKIVNKLELGQDRIVTFSVVFFIWIIIAIWVSRIFDKMDFTLVDARANSMNKLQKRVEK